MIGKGKCERQVLEQRLRGMKNCSAKQNENLKFLELIQEGTWERGEIRGTDKERGGKRE